MGTIKITPEGVPVEYNPIAREITLPAIDDWVDIDESLARKTVEEGIPWCPAMADWLTSRFPCYINDNNGNYHPVRLGVGVALVTNRGMVFIKYSDSHPTRPGRLTPPAGLWQDGDPYDAALRELGEELIITRPRGDYYPKEVGFWKFGGLCFGKAWVQEYIQGNALRDDPDLRVNHNFTVHLEPIIDFEGIWTFEFGDGYQVKGLVAFEPETGGIEMLVPLRAHLPEDADLVDGERSPDGQWLHRKVVYVQPRPTQLTTKAEAVICAFG